MKGLCVSLRRNFKGVGTCLTNQTVFRSQDFSLPTQPYCKQQGNVIPPEQKQNELKASEYTYCTICTTRNDPKAEICITCGSAEPRLPYLQ